MHLPRLPDYQYYSSLEIPGKEIQGIYIVHYNDCSNMQDALYRRGAEYDPKNHPESYTTKFYVYNL